MLTLIRILIGTTVQALTGTVKVIRTCIDILGAVDTLLSDFGGVQKGGILDTTLVDIDRITLPSTCYTIVDTMRKFLCHAYTFDGVGITYTMAREVLDTRERFDQYQARTKDDLG